MKLKNLFLAVLAGAAALVACEELEDLVSPMISLDPTELTFQAQEGSQSITLKASLNWAVTTDLSGKWVALSQESGNASKDGQTISVSVEKNESYDREIDIVFAAGSMVKSTLKVTQKGSQGTYVAEEGDGTQEKPYNVAQAVALVQNLTWTSSSDYQKTDKVYVKGKITSIKYPYDFSNGTATFDITDDGTTAAGKLTAYSLYYLGGNKWLEGNAQIAVDDIVVIYGELMNYQGNTPETVKATSYLYSLNGVTEDNNGRVPDFSDAESKTIAEFISAASTSTYYKVAGTVYGNINTTYGNFNIKDDTGTIQVYGAVNWNEWKDKVKANSKVVVAGTYKKYNETDEIVNGYILSCEDGEAENYDNAPAKTVEEFIAAADKANYYKLTGKVSKFNSNYCSFDLTDETGTIYVYSVANKEEWKDKIADGGTVVLAGMYDYYASKSQHEVVNAQILSFEAGETIDYSAVPEKTVTDFIAAADKANYYKLTGKVSGFNANYCSFDLTDETGTIYVYSVANKADWADKLADGGTVVLAGLYDYYASKSQHEVINAHILSFTEGEAGPEENATGDGTLDNPYNPKAAADVASALEDKAKTENDVYVQGKVSSVKYTFSAQFGTATFYISEDGTTSGTQFQVYSVYYLGNKAWEEGDAQIAAGDDVIICGKLTNYGGTPETSSKEAYIYSLNGQTSIEQSAVFGVEKTEINVSASATSAEIKVTGNVAWTVSRKSDQVTCNPTSGEGAGTVTVTFPANESTESEVSYSVVLSTEASVDNNTIVVNITQTKASSGNTNVITIPLTNATTFAEDNGGDVLKNGWVATVEGYKVATYKYKSTSNPITPDQYSMRVYKSAVFYIEAPAGKTIKALCFKANNYDNGKYILDLTGVEGTEGTAVADKTDAIIKWEGSASTVTLQAAAGQTRLESVEVYFE